MGVDPNTKRLILRMPSHLFLEQKVDVVDAQRRKLLVGAINEEEQSTKGNIDLAVRRTMSENRQSNSPAALSNSHMIAVALLEAVHLAMHDVVVHIGEGGLGGRVELAPALLLLCAVEVEGARVPTHAVTDH